MPDTPALTASRLRRATVSATLTAGAIEVVDFLLPLYAGAALELPAGQVGVLMAAEIGVSLLVRPFAGVLSDRHDRRLVAGIGAALYALACLGFAVSTTLSAAMAASAVAGAAGALLWVALRAMAAERLPHDSGALAALVAAESTGGWLVFVPALSLLAVIDYRGVFVGLAACCVVAAGWLFTGPRSAPESDEDGGGLGAVGRRLRPMLLAVVATMAAEAAIGLLILLHLQRGHHMEPLQIAYVFLPGAIVMGVLPEYLHRWVVRWGRRRMLAAASLASAGFAAGLAAAPGPFVIAALWVAAAAAWSIVIPVQQAVVAEASGRHRLGRGLGLYEAACLAGGLLGTVGAGCLYQAGSWQWGCLVAAGVILSGAVVVPTAVRRLGVVDRPAAPEPADVPPPVSPGTTAPTPVVAGGTGPADDPGTGASAGTDASPASVDSPAKSRRELWRDLARHTGLFGVVTVVVTWLAWPPTPAMLGIGPESRGILEAFQAVGEDPVAVVVAAWRIWLVIWVIDLLWTSWRAVTTPRR
ncbi:putative MFS family arabinose efflux permease [Stackebrandtia albiflava]|uniref:Putative MFS family arabinose efflux permease n=1 Tax=Stackebrandtia albiflava TaxID=406432 RepID=A0A562UQC2_9ACTN|nr:MFS transporter [Stackebrandtia albiflava]TWJ07806.1 putative MFS family arabinose efflux permease [Stackebrandtia albiflava]